MTDALLPDETSREQFEDWAESRNMKIARDRQNPDFYAFAHAKHAWQGWCAALSRSAVPPEPNSQPGDWLKGWQFDPSPAPEPKEQS